MAAVFNYFCLAILLDFSSGKQEIYKINDVIAADYDLPSLPYDYDELEPYIDKETLRVHHQGHHAAYTKKLNAVLESWRQYNHSWPAEESIQTILIAIEKIPQQYKSAIVNNGGGFVNHNLYWWIMSPNPDEEDRKPSSNLMTDIERSFGSFDKFKEAFTQKALSLFGSGYVWLSRQPKDRMLIISTTANQDSPLSQGLCPILVIDVWEHAYYLKHKNKRPNHISDWWKLVDWKNVEELDSWFLKNKGHDELYLWF
ncbi:superoxide dismutase [Mn/Fe]-like [Mytilus galloprovincialis]|uniref:superoxide dismutase [Mn/Fe]-like n=1 Tax=Mytilus galloprovincialis TaxID=29158 RepID=UPI003F7BB341